MERTFNTWYHDVATEGSQIDSNHKFVWNTVLGQNVSFLNDKEYHKFKIAFKKNISNDKGGIYIQPNKTSGKYVKFEIKNVKISEEVNDYSLPMEPMYKTTFLLPCQLMKVGDISDRLYWDSKKKKYIIEKKVDIPEGYDKVINESLVIQTSQLIETNITKEILLPSYKDKTHLFIAGGIDGSIKAKVPVDGGKVIGVLQEENIKLKEINEVQDELINTTMLATDEMYMMLEPLLVNMFNDSKSINSLVNMYVAMINRGLKTIEHVPERYREQVKKIIDQSETELSI